MKRKNGFTLVEALLVVSLVAIGSGVVLGYLNIGQHQERTADAVAIQRMEEMAGLISSYFIQVGEMPEDPVNDPDVRRFIGAWPEGFELATFNDETFCISTLSEADPTTFIKYASDNLDEPSNNDCVGKVLQHCRRSCLQNRRLTDCEDEQGDACNGYNAAPATRFP